MKVFYRKKNESVINQKRLPIEGESEPAFKIAYYIKIEENIDDNLKVQIFDNKTSQLFNDNDLIPKDSFLEYEVLTPEQMLQHQRQAQQQQALEAAASKLQGNPLLVGLNQQIAQTQDQAQQEAKPQDQNNFLNIMNENKKKTELHVKHRNQMAVAQNEGVSHSNPQRNYNNFNQANNQVLNNPMFESFRTQKFEIHKNYRCQRCQQPGHHIKECPTNSDPTYDPYKGKGQPKDQAWKRDLGINNQEFLDNKHKVFREIIKESRIYGGQFDIKKFKQQQSNPSDVFNVTTVQGQNIGSSLKSNWREQIPPSLVCQICKDLIKRASLTKCCAFSGCQKCLQQKLIERQFQCPYCKSVNVYAEDIIPNQQLRLVAEWFSRQMLIQDKVEEIEIKRTSNQDKDEMIYMISKIEQTFQSHDQMQQQQRMLLQQQQDLQNQHYDSDSQSSQGEGSQDQHLQVKEGDIDLNSNQDLNNQIMLKGAVDPANPLKFNPQLHSGTKFDPALGRRVPVTDPNELPKIGGASNTQNINDLQTQARFYQMQMMQLMQQNMTQAQMMGRYQFQGANYPGQIMMDHNAGMINPNGASGNHFDRDHGQGRRRSRSRSDGDRARNKKKKSKKH
ncbi:dwnn-domain-containing protein [Stylonychia lemnae]|uniref:Dwnn-domain-containing protein n=1 Tax=Stylonychia lemnae TaxID=5949 RepID=A0A078A3Q9_STYLE|nr:dwnn-domain-containing protein [Stylonychia lemnae]|eukprot:CDW76888.1 dwnn-domain-containing protein [Stylonychia lemnae]